MNLQKARLLLILFGALGLVLLPLGAALRSELILYAELCPGGGGLVSLQPLSPLPQASGPSHRHLLPLL